MNNIISFSSKPRRHSFRRMNTSKAIEEKLSSLAENYQSTTDAVNRLQQTCANLLLENTKHYQLEVLNHLDTIEKKVEHFNHHGT